MECQSTGHPPSITHTTASSSVTHLSHACSSAVLSPLHAAAATVTTAAKAKTHDQHSKWSVRALDTPPLSLTPPLARLSLTCHMLAPVPCCHHSMLLLPLSPLQQRQKHMTSTANGVSEHWTPPLYHSHHR